MLQNAYLLAKIGADTAENEQHFAENLPIGRRVVVRGLAADLYEAASAQQIEAQDLRGRGEQVLRGLDQVHALEPCACTTFSEG